MAACGTSATAVGFLEESADSSVSLLAIGQMTDYAGKDIEGDFE